LLQSHLEGKVVVGSGARIIRSRVCNYHIGEGALVEGVTALESRRRRLPLPTLPVCEARASA